MRTFWIALAVSVALAIAGVAFGIFVFRASHSAMCPPDNPNCQMPKTPPAQ